MAFSEEKGGENGEQFLQERNLRLPVTCITTAIAPPDLYVVTRSSAETRGEDLNVLPGQQPHQQQHNLALQPGLDLCQLTTTTLSPHSSHHRPPHCAPYRVAAHTQSLDG